MQMAMQQDAGTRISAPPEKCPFSPRHILPNSTGVHLYTAPANRLFYASIISHPAVVAQTEAHYRIASERARLKRGPPVIDPLVIS